MSAKAKLSMTGRDIQETEIKLELIRLIVFGTWLSMMSMMSSPMMSQSLGLCVII